MNKTDRIHANWEARALEPPDDERLEIDDVSMAGLLRKAFDAGFDAACDYWENPVQYLDVDINDHQDKEREKTVKLLG